MGTVVYKPVWWDRDRAQLTLGLLCVLEAQVVGEVIKLHESFTFVYWCLPNFPTKVSSTACGLVAMSQIPGC
jgi:hypothetical protein